MKALTSIQLTAITLSVLQLTFVTPATLKRSSNTSEFNHDFSKFDGQNQLSKVHHDNNQNEPLSMASRRLVKRSADDTQMYSIGNENPAMVDEMKRNKVKEMMQHAWSNYKRYAWGKNELRPVSKSANTGRIFGSLDIGATIVDAMDTLYVMGMKSEFDECREWIAENFTLDNASAVVSVFETNIRFVGGFLAAFALTGDPVFKEKAQHVADKLLPAFQTPTGIPYGSIDLGAGVGHSTDAILSEFGTLHLEFAYLSDITGNPVYRERVMKVRSVLRDLHKPDGLYPSHLDVDSGEWGFHHMSMGAQSDSFYEYLLKAWLQSGQSDAEARTMFDEAMAAIVEHMVRNSSQNGLTYVSDMSTNTLEHKMEHLACFAGGLFGLASHTSQSERSGKFMELSEGITNTCHESYVRTATHLGPEVFRFDSALEAQALNSQESFYILRPETFESYFIMWRLTHNQKYRDWGWDAIQALEKYCRSDGGYSGIDDVNANSPKQNDIQESFFLAESLKYLYLLFSDDSLLPLEEWVFNTEAHPLPIKGVNHLYRSSSL